MDFWAEKSKLIQEFNELLEMQVQLLSISFKNELAEGLNRSFSIFQKCQEDLASKPYKTFYQWLNANRLDEKYDQVYRSYFIFRKYRLSTEIKIYLQEHLEIKQFVTEISTISFDNILQMLIVNLNKALNFGVNLGNKILQTKFSFSDMDKNLFARILHHQKTLIEGLRQQIETQLQYHILMSMRNYYLPERIILEITDCWNPTMVYYHPPIFNAQTHQLLASAVQDKIDFDKFLELHFLSLFRKVFNLGEIDVYQQQGITHCKIISNPESCDICKMYPANDCEINTMNYHFPYHIGCNCNFVPILK